MCSVESLREFVTERLTAAAEEIFGVFEKKIVEYEEEIDRQRRLLDVVWKPVVQLHRLEQRVCGEEEEDLSNQKRNSSLDQEEPEPPQIKGEHEELCTSQGEQFDLKQETENFMLVPSQEESDQQLLSHSSNVAEIQDQNESNHVDLRSTGSAESELKKRHDENTSGSNTAGNKNKRYLKCDTCSKEFDCRSKLLIHLRVHTGERPYVCNTCGKRFTQSSALNAHLKIHTDEKPCCKICGKLFTTSGNLRVHIRCTHIGQKLYLCRTCGRRFPDTKELKCHMRRHTELPQQAVCQKKEVLTDQQLLLCHSSPVAQIQPQEGSKQVDSGSAGEAETTPKKRLHQSNVSETLCETDFKPYKCDTCGKCYKYKCRYKIHLRSHTAERPFVCNICKKRFNESATLNYHLKTHTGEKPHLCVACGKSFYRSSELNAHLRVHTGEKPYVCGRCDKRFRQKSSLKSHLANQKDCRTWKDINALIST